jgi:hypothetical protein
MKLSQLNAALGTGDSAEIATEPGTKSVVNTSGAAGTATIGVAALATGRHVCKGLSVSVAAGAAAQPAVRAVLRDGATGAGTIIWSKTLACAAGGFATVDLTGLSLVGSLNTAMTLEFAAAGAANSIEDVTLIYFDLTEGLTR